MITVLASGFLKLNILVLWLYGRKMPRKTLSYLIQFFHTEVRKFKLHYMYTCGALLQLLCFTIGLHLSLFGFFWLSNCHIYCIVHTFDFLIVTEILQNVRWLSFILQKVVTSHNMISSISWKWFSLSGVKKLLPWK